MFGIKTLSLCSILVLCLLILSCSNDDSGVTELKHYPVNSPDEIITRSGITIDKEVSSDGDGSLRARVSKPTTIRLYEISDIEIENARLIYRAEIRTQGVEGEVYLEMWCRLSSKGEYFSRALHSTLSGTNEWTTQETPFIFKKGQKATNVKLNLVIKGKGTVWIDSIRLLKAPL